MHIHQILPGPQELSTEPDASGKMRNQEYRPGIQARDVRRAFLHFSILGTIDGEMSAKEKQW